MVNVNEQKGFYEDARLNFNEANVRFAIGVYGDSDFLSKTDTRYVKWFATYTKLEDDGSTKETMLPMKKCTQEDLDQFFPLNED